jgi:hypothetical protein
MEVIDQKKEIVDWISALENPDIVNIVYYFKEKPSFDFDEEVKKAIPINEF